MNIIRMNPEGKMTRKTAESGVIDREALRKMGGLRQKYRTGEVKLSADKFYTLLYYYPKANPAPHDAGNHFLPFNSPSEAMNTLFIMAYA